MNRRNFLSSLIAAVALSPFLARMRGEDLPVVEKRWAAGILTEAILNSVCRIQPDCLSKEEPPPLTKP